MSNRIRPSKYRAIRTEVDGIKFHSKGEAFRWMELKLLQRAGWIASLKRQVPFTLHTQTPYGQPDSPLSVTTLGKYVADFTYVNEETNENVAEDFKGFDTPLSKWKRKHAETEYGIKILLTGPAAKRRRK